MNPIIKFFEENTKREQKEKRIKFKHLNKYAKKNQIVFSGSSLCEHFPLNEMSQDLNLDKLIYNRGIGGDTTENLLDSLRECIIDLEPSKLFINIGTNDMGKPGYDESQLISNFDLILTKTRQQLPNTKFYIMSYYPVNRHIKGNIPEENKKLFFGSRTNKAIQSANIKLQSLSEKYDATYIDVSSILFDDKGQLDSNYTIEGIHLWPNAYIKVLDILKDYLSE